MRTISRDEFIGEYIPHTHRTLVWWAVQIYRPVVATILKAHPKGIQVTAAAWEHAERVVHNNLSSWVTGIQDQLLCTIGMDVVTEYQLAAYQMVTAAVIADARAMLKGVHT